MVYNCKNICKDYQVVKEKFAQSYYDIENARYCAMCCIFVKWEGVWCPCCSVKLRTKKKYKGYLARKESKRLNIINVTVKV